MAVVLGVQYGAVEGAVYAVLVRLFGVVGPYALVAARVARPVLVCLVGVAKLEMRIAPPVE